MSLGPILAAARERRVFSAAAWAVGTADVTLDRGTLGTLRWGGPAAGEESAWDLASLTKPIVGLAVMGLLERGALTLEDTVGGHLAAYRGTDKRPLTVRQLLAHTSGLPGGTPLYRESPPANRCCGPSVIDRSPAPRERPSSTPRRASSCSG